MLQNVLSIVIGTSYSTIYGVVRSLGEAHIKTDVLMIQDRGLERQIISSSRYVDNVFHVREKDPMAVVSFLLKKYSKRTDYTYKVLIPTGDFSASICDEFCDRLSSVFLLPHGERPGEIIRLMNKEVQLDMAKSLGIETARSWEISLANDIVIPDTMTYPCFVKPEISIRGGKTEMKKCNTFDELLVKLQQMKEKDPDRAALVQEYLEIEEEYIITGLCLDQIVFAPDISKRIRVAQTHHGLTVCGTIIDTEVLGKHRNSFIDLLKAFHYVGLFGLDVFKCLDGRIIFNEMNFRATGVIYAITGAGANLPQMMIEYLVSAKIPQDPEMKYGLIFFHDIVAWKERIAGTLSASEFKRLKKMSDFSTIYNKEDPMPHRLLMIQLPYRYARRFGRTVLDGKELLLKRFREGNRCR